MRKLLLFLLLTTLFNSGINAQTVRFVASNVAGTGDGMTAENAADFLSDTFWSNIQRLLQTESVTVKFAAGDYVRAYTTKSLTLSNMGHAQNQLILEGDLSNTIFTAPIGFDTKSIMVWFSNSQNIVMRNFRFTGNGSINYVFRVSSSSGKTSRNILIENCHWYDIRGVIYGSAGTSGSGTAYVTFKNCSFKRIGLNSGSHMIYNAYDANHISVIDSHFEDCTGDYVRFRDNLDYAVVKGTTFIRTPGFVNYPFISMPLFNDVNPGDEFFATNYSFTNNTFTNANTAIHFYSSGFDPVGRNHLLTAREGEILSEGTDQQKKELLLNNFKLNTDLIRIYNNIYNSISNQVTIKSVTAYGSVSKGWTGEANISGLFNTSNTPLAWEEDYFNLQQGAWNNEKRTLSYNLGAGTGSVSKVLTGTPPLTTGAGSVSSESTPGFLPYIPVSDGGGFVRVGYPSSNAIFTLQDSDPQNATLKINSSGSGNPAKFSVYNIANASTVTSVFYTIKFDNGPATQVEWTFAMGNNTGAANILSNASSLTATSSTSNPEIFNAFRWRIDRANPGIIDFQYRIKPLVTGNAVYTTANSTSFYRGGEFNIEVYANNHGVTQQYTRGGVIYELPSRTYHVWSNGERMLRETDKYDFPANQLASGENINSFMIHGTNSSSTPSPETVVGDNSAELTIGKIKMGFANAASLPIALLSFDVKKQDQAVAIAWVSSSEINNSHFEILRSTSGNVFEKIGTVQAKGNSNQNQYYSFTDHHPVPGNNYYKLRQVDFDGTIKSYEVKVVNMAFDKVEDFKIYSSSEDSKVHFYYLSESTGGALLQIMSVSGQKIAEQKKLLMQGNNSFSVNVNLGSGIYVAVLKANNKVIARKFIK